MTDFVPYEPGTIEVTNGSKNIVGTGTDFSVYSGGDTIWVDGYPVLLDGDPSSDTAALAKYNYLGTSGSGKSYRWVPLGDLSRAIALDTRLSSYFTSGNLSAEAGLVGAADKVSYYTGVGTKALTDFTTQARELLNDTSYSAMLTTLGFSTFGKTIIDDADAAAVRDTIAAGGVIRHQVFTASGTYTPHAKMLYCLIEAVGGGGGSGGGTGSASQGYGSGGGGSGGYSAVIASKASIGASRAVTIGAAGAAGAAGNNNGGAGGATIFDGFLQANGGSGGGTGWAGAIGSGGAGGSVSGAVGTILLPGGDGEVGTYINSVTVTNFFIKGGDGAASRFGAKRTGTGANTAGAGNGLAAKNYGSGAGGGGAINTTATYAGAAGSAGLLIVTEFCSA